MNHKDLKKYFPKTYLFLFNFLFIPRLSSWCHTDTFLAPKHLAADLKFKSTCEKYLFDKEDEMTCRTPKEKNTHAPQKVITSLV